MMMMIVKSNDDIDDDNDDYGNYDDDDDDGDDDDDCGGGSGSDGDIDDGKIEWWHSHNHRERKWHVKKIRPHTLHKRYPRVWPQSYNTHTTEYTWQAFYVFNVLR